MRTGLCRMNSVAEDGRDDVDGLAVLVLEGGSAHLEERERGKRIGARGWNAVSGNRRWSARQGGIERDGRWLLGEIAALGTHERIAAALARAMDVPGQCTRRYGSRCVGLQGRQGRAGAERVHRGAGRHG